MRTITFDGDVGWRCSLTGIYPEGDVDYDTALKHTSSVLLFMTEVQSSKTFDFGERTAVSAPF